MSAGTANLAPRRPFPWLAATFSAVFAAVLLYSLAQLETPRQGLAADFMIIPNEFQTPIKTFSPPLPPYAGGVLLLHGYGGSKEMMQGLAADLAQEGFYTFCLDLPGCGDSQQTFKPEKNLPALESAYLDLLGRGLLMSDRIAVIGHSMGGGLAVKLAADHTEIRATVALSAMPSNVNKETPRNLLLLTAEQDLPGLKKAAARMWELAVPGREFTESTTMGDFVTGTARRAATIPGANHLTILYSQAVREEVKEWLRSSFQIASPPKELHSRNIWIGAAHLSALLLFIPLVFVAAFLYPLGQEAYVVTGFPPWRFLAFWTGACWLGGLLGALLPKRYWIPIQVTDFVAWTILLSGALLWTAAWISRVRLHVKEWSLLRPLLWACGGFLFLYLSFGLVANEEWLHMGLSGGRWPIMARVALFLAPLWVLLELVLRGYQQRRGIWRTVVLSWLYYLVLVVGILLPSFLKVGQTESFLLQMSIPFLLAFFMLFSILSAFLFQASRSVVCCAAWNVAVFGWLFTATFFWK